MRRSRWLGACSIGHGLVLDEPTVSLESRYPRSCARTSRRIPASRCYGPRTYRSGCDNDNVVYAHGGSSKHKVRFHGSEWGPRGTARCPPPLSPQARRRSRERGAVGTTAKDGFADAAVYPRLIGFTPIRVRDLPLEGIIWREGLRFLHQRRRSVSALVPPLVWLFVFTAFPPVLGISILPPTRPTSSMRTTSRGPVLIILLFVKHAELARPWSTIARWARAHAAREPPAALVLLVCEAARRHPGRCPRRSTLSRWSHILWGIEPPLVGHICTVLPALLLAGLMLGALGLLLSSVIRQLENFAGARMNFVIFPMFSPTSALYALWHPRGKPPPTTSAAQPVHHAVEVHFVPQDRFIGFSLSGGRGLRGMFMSQRDPHLHDPARHSSAARRAGNVRWWPFVVAAVAICLPRPGMAHAADPRFPGPARSDQGAGALGAAGMCRVHRSTASVGGKHDDKGPGRAARRAPHAPPTMRRKAMRRFPPHRRRKPSGSKRRTSDFRGIASISERGEVMRGMEPLYAQAENRPANPVHDSSSSRDLQDEPMRDAGKVDELAARRQMGPASEDAQDRSASSVRFRFSSSSACLRSRGIQSNRSSNAYLPIDPSVIGPIVVVDQRHAEAQQQLC